VAAHLVWALDTHLKELRRNAARPPEGLDELVALFASRARQGQVGSSPDAEVVFPQAPVIPRRLLSYEEVADSLACSVRTVKRLVAAGRLRRVLVSGSARISVSDLDHYVNAIMQEEDHVDVESKDPRAAPGPGDGDEPRPGSPRTS
jgi:excisionase family DNA binding protein